MRITFICFLLAALSSTAYSELTTNQSASSVLGQPDFVSASSADPPTARTLQDPEGIVVDPTTGKVFVADYGNHRVLRYSSAAAYTTNPVAEAVFGQGDFVSKALADPPTSSSLNNPAGLAIDGQGRLWVSDYGNSRVLRYDNAATKASSSPADAVLGQPDFVSKGAPAVGPHSGFDGPGGLAIDSAGRLWVADYGLHRILRFDNAATLSFNASANVVLGQPDFETFTSGTSSTTLKEPWGLWLDTGGRLWVGDSGNDRVLRFDNAAGKMDEDPADGVLGQDEFDLSANGVTANRFGEPWYIAVTPDGTVWVSDYENSRVVGFRNGASKAKGASAEIVLGQPNLTTDTNEAASARSIPGAYGLAVGKAGSLLVGDYSSHRVMVFEDIPAVIDNSALKTSLKKKLKKLKKKLKKAKSSSQVAKIKKLKKQIKSTKKKLKAL